MIFVNNCSVLNVWSMFWFLFASTGGQAGVRYITEDLVKKIAKEDAMEMITNLNLTLAKEGGKKIKVTIKTQQWHYFKVPLKKSIFTETHSGTIIHFCVETFVRKLWIPLSHSVSLHRKCMSFKIDSFS